MFVILDESQKEEICKSVESLFSEPSPVDGSCGMFTMPESLIKERANHFNDCLMSVYTRVHENNDSIGMFEIVSALDSYFDIGYLVKNVLSEEVIKLISEQLYDFMQTRCKKTEIDFNDSMIPSEFKDKIVSILVGKV